VLPFGWELRTCLLWLAWIVTISALSIAVREHAGSLSSADPVIRLASDTEVVNGSLASTEVLALSRIPIEISTPIQSEATIKWELTPEPPDGLIRPLPLSQAASGEVKLAPGASASWLDFLIAPDAIGESYEGNLTLISAESTSVVQVAEKSTKILVQPRPRMNFAWLHPPQTELLEGEDKRLDLVCELSHPLEQDVQIPVQLVGLEKEPTKALFTFPEGEIKSATHIDILDDQLPQKTRRLLVSLMPPEKELPFLTIQTLASQVNLLNDDQPSLSLTMPAITLREGGPQRSTVHINSPTPLPYPIGLTLSASGTLKLDDLEIDGKRADRIEIPEGTSSYSFQLDCRDDELVEGVESGQLLFDIDSDGWALNANVGDVTIEDNDYIRVAVRLEPTGPVGEGESRTLIVATDPESSSFDSDLRFRLEFDEAASNARKDAMMWEDQSFPLPQPGEDSQIELTATQNNRLEGTRTYVVNLSFPQNVQSTSNEAIAIQILDDEAVSLALRTDAASTDLKESETTIRLIASIDEGVQFDVDKIEIPLMMDGTSATEGKDFHLSQRAFEFKKGPTSMVNGKRTAELTVAIVDDDLAENTETLRFSINGDKGESVNFTIEDDDPFRISTNPNVASEIIEGSTGSQIEVSLEDKIDLNSRTISIPFTYSGDGAARLKSPTASPLKLTQSERTATISLELLDDDKFSVEDQLKIELKPSSDIRIATNQKKYTFQLKENDIRQEVTAVLLVYNWYVKENWGTFQSLASSINEYDENLISNNIQLVGRRDGKVVLFPTSFANPAPKREQLEPLETEPKSQVVDDLLMPAFERMQQWSTNLTPPGIILLYADPFRHEDRQAGAPLKKLAPPPGIDNVAFFWIHDVDFQDEKESPWLRNRLGEMKIALGKSKSPAVWFVSLDELKQRLPLLLEQLIADRLKK